MKEYGILFKPEMVRAILDGRKTMTRRIITSPYKNYPCYTIHSINGPETRFVMACDDEGFYPDQEKRIVCPYGEVGDRLWVKETFWECIDNNDRIYYATTETPETTDRRHYKKRSSLFMKRLQSRIDLELTNVRIERLQDVTEENVVREGFTSRTEFIEYIKMINGPDVWDKNPFVWMIEFRRIK